MRYLRVDSNGELHTTEDILMFQAFSSRVTARCDTCHTHITMPSHTSGYEDNFDDDDDLFGGLEPFKLPPHLELGGNIASSSGSRAAIDGFGTVGISGTGDGDLVDEMEWEEEERQDTLIPELIRYWTNERLAPDILDQRGELIQRVLERVREQVGRLSPSFLF
jgi:hypothetical protein